VREWSAPPITRLRPRARGAVARAGGPVREDPVHAGASGHYGLLWWDNGDGAMSGVPTDAFWSWGSGDSFILVVPSEGLVVSRAGHAWQKGWTADYRVLAPFFQAVVVAVE
jgi:CubicO group peptidase (beta-lactamase class C family)